MMIILNLWQKRRKARNQMLFVWIPAQYGEQLLLRGMPLHASSSGESFPLMNSTVADGCTSDESTSVPEVYTSSATERSIASPLASGFVPGTSQTIPSGAVPAIADAWKRVEDPEKAAPLYRTYLLRQKEDERTLKVSIDMREDIEGQEGRLISFYKVQKVDWARPLHCRLEGDVATGDGVKRHFFSLVMHKLQKGFSMDFGNRTGTLLFEGQDDHLIPSTSQVLVQSDLFKMAGRMIGHSFLHGGPPLTGVSPAILHVLLGGSPETATISLEDVADIDIQETIQLLTVADYSRKKADDEKTNDNELTEHQRVAVDNLALSWDLPVLTTINHDWLLPSLLQHSVLGRTSQQIKQLRQGLQESMLWPLLEARPDVVTVVFPCQAMAGCNSQMVLNSIIWPGEGGEEDDNGCPVAIRCKIAGYLRQFVETVPEDKLKQLVKFWVGWELPMQDMQVEVVQADHPTSSTCFHILRLPGHYASYEHFHDHLEGCIATSDCGFGLI
ncbi:uncharacterized protein LOC117830224 [Notolabrus celidotus]|uniref:uncharacterized protein LOC117830224 n=1 Tax=Notolabrus celidotus TaxID=1203425 RepID=UPI00149050F5|nr:uncharacterized protein LOC117830224 [Notolabrus celidotus]